MRQPKVILSQVNIVAKNFDRTLQFHRMAGLDIPAPMSQPQGALLELDNEYLGGIYHAGVRRGAGSPCRAIIGLTLESREQVDSTYAKLVAAGHPGRQPPCDAFWGARYAVVADPEGNDVGLMSPMDERYRSWPPTNPPEL